MVRAKLSVYRISASNKDCRAIAFAPEGPYDPHTFAPERFLVADGEDMPTDPAVWAFGFARR